MKHWVFVLTMGMGAVIWLASPAMTGRAEPWDAHSPYYIVALFGAGFFAAIVEPQRFWRWPIAIYLGQCAAIIVQALLRPGGDLGLFFPMGMAALAFYAVLSFIGSSAGACIRWLIKRFL